MKTFKEILEALTSSQKAKVDSWGPSSAADKISSHVFPNGHDRITIPLENHEGDVEAHPHVKNYLENNGYKIKHYKKGLATDKYGRDVNIGKALQKTNAPELVNKAYINDPNRASGKHNNLQVVITKHPYDVAGMSTDRGWESCMTMGDCNYNNHGKGSNAKYLPLDIQQGTHVAYLTHAGDHKAEDPIARIALKPFHSYHAHETHTILRPEHTIYGDGGPAFEQTVKKFAEKHYPMDSNSKVYNKDSSLYHDSGPRQLINVDHPKILFGATKEMKEELIKHGKHLNTLMHDEDSNIRRQVARVGNKEHLDHLVNDNDYHVREDVAGKGFKDHLDKLVNDPHHAVRYEVASRGTKEHLDKLVNDPQHAVRKVIAMRGNKEHLDKLVNDPEDYVRQEVASHGHKEHLNKLINDPNEYTRMMVARKGTKEHLDRLVDDPSELVRANVANRGFSEHHEKLISDPKNSVRRQVAEYSNNKSHLDKLMNDPDKLVRIKAEKRYTELP